MKTLAPGELKPRLTAGEEIAFLDVREHGQYGEGHPFFCVPFPYSRLEAMVAALLPCRRTSLVLMDDGDGVAERAAFVLDALGFEDISVLEGGAPGWRDAGYTLFKGVNLPSKTYGELLEHVAGTPRLTAVELNDRLSRDADMVVLDGRSPEEYRKMSLPGALCVPNAELGYRIASLAPDPGTTVVINCAGRTRSILGAEGLRILGVPNPVFALENGTQGWKLAGFELEHGVEPQALPEPDEVERRAQADTARRLIDASGLERISPETVEAWLADESRTTYLLDVRTRAEFEKAHWPGARHAPGGQLVQATDQYVAVRYARLVLSDDNRLRAATTAIRLRDMGHHVYLLDADASAGASSNTRPARPEPDTSFPEPAELEGVVVLDASSGMDYREGHIDGVPWATRARLARLGLEDGAKILVTGRDPVLIAGVSAELLAMGFVDVATRGGDPSLWERSGHRIVQTQDEPGDEDCIDYLFFVHDRHDGNLDAARRYLEWETGLIAQLDEQERGALKPTATFDKGTAA